MDEQRQEAYSKLIQTLLKDSSECEKIEILKANKNLIDAGLLQILKQLSNTVQLVTILAPKLAFLTEVLQATSDSDSDLQVLLCLLLANLDKLDDCFALLLRLWAALTLPKQTPRQAQLIAKVVSDFSNLIKKFPAGNKAINIEIAIAACEVVATVFTHEAFPEQWAANQNNLGIAYSSRLRENQAQNEEMALTAYENALQVYTREAFPKEWAGVHANLSKLYSKRVLGDRGQNLEQAIHFYKEALQVFTREAFPQDFAIVLNHLSLVYHDQGQFDQAIKCFRSALGILTPSASPLMYHMTGQNLGKMAFLAERWSEAIEAYGVAIEAVETTRAMTPLDSWPGLTHSASSATGEWGVPLLEQRSEQRDLLSVRKSYLRQKILEGAIGIYEKMVQACINDAQLEKAIETIERSRSKRLVDLMASNDLYQGSEIPPKVKELLQQFDDLQERIDQKRSPFDSVNSRELMGEGTSTLDRAAFQAYNEEIATLEAEKQQIWEQLRRLDPVLAGEIKVDAPNLVQMQKLIDQPTSAIVSFYTTAQNLHIFILRQNQITLHTCPDQGIEPLQGWISQNWLQPYAASCHPNRPKSERDQLRAEWISQISPFLTELAQRLQLTDLIAKHLNGIEELIVVPHLLLHQIPFAALPVQHSEHRYLGDKFLIRYTPSCQVLEFCKQRGEVTENFTYGTVEDATNDLPFASFEGEQIAQLHQISSERRLRGSSRATRDNYRQLAEKVQVLHSCHHAESCLDEPLNSQLKLGDGSITLGQLMSPGWRLPNLSDVFLSCCETGLGFPEITDDILTLSTGFLCAGARSVVSTLWAVNDLATAIFSIFYYQHRQQGCSRPEAVRQAQIELRELNKEKLLNREDIQELSRQAEAGFEEAKSKRKQYQRGSTKHREWQRKCLKYEKLRGQLDNIKDYPDEKLFSHPYYWAAFACQGLR
ncbi:MAG: CHAT domain-containing protein [Symplocastrum torsivum CPER-KK1]|jgi:CHAT domain-containing protein|uniref:CHAT domain-containing protein n=1 Tax=Symplocastrum torsivum CPER-KK1 TaxID=450513 RepID=A0A951UCX2_9CYAN|nr:CHAT domain-containing protein [Symplocastrum torsivum CPER-KK1]